MTKGRADRMVFQLALIMPIKKIKYTSRLSITVPMTISKYLYLCSNNEINKNSWPMSGINTAGWVIMSLVHLPVNNLNSNWYRNMLFEPVHSR